MNGKVRIEVAVKGLPRKTTTDEVVLGESPEFLVTRKGYRGWSQTLLY